MKKCVNGKIVEMTAEEIKELQEAQAQYEAEMAKMPPTEAERLEAIESALLELAEVMVNG